MRKEAKIMEKHQQRRVSLLAAAVFLSPSEIN